MGHPGIKLDSLIRVERAINDLQLLRVVNAVFNAVPWRIILHFRVRVRLVGETEIDVLRVRKELWQEVGGKSGAGTGGRLRLGDDGATAVHLPFRLRG